MKIPWIAIGAALAIASPQFWGRIGMPSQLQPVFMLLLVALAFNMGGLRLPRTASSRTILGGLVILLLGGLLSTPFVLAFELHFQEAVRRIVLALFLWAAFSIASRSDRLLRAAQGLAVTASVVYLATLLLYIAGWAPLSDSGDFDAYPLGILLPIPVYSNPLIFSETQVFGYFLLGTATLAASQRTGPTWLALLVGLLQFGKGPIAGYVASKLPSLSRVVMLLLVIAAPALLVVSAFHGDVARFDGNFGSFAERSFHLSSVQQALVEHPLRGVLGYGFRQYGSYLLTQSTGFTPDSVPLSVAQWTFESGLLISLVGMTLLTLGAIVLCGRRHLPAGICLFIGHLALPNPADASVLLLFAILAGSADRHSSIRDDQVRLP